MRDLLDSFRAAGRAVVLCGDYNIAHREIDLANPRQNRNNAGFLPEERAWMDALLEGPYIDAFRHFVPDTGHYTWWSYRPTVRERNIGWRIDHFVVSAELGASLARAYHQPLVLGSDHCPVVVELDL
jgi:exodeoxyribonuclease-3